MDKTRVVGVVAMLLTVTQAPMVAQTSVPAQTTRQPHVALPILGGLLAGGAGVLGGALAGATIECDGPCDGEWEGFAGLIIGAVVGEALLYPIGVHIGNGGRGNLGFDMATSVGIIGSSFLVAAAINEPEFLALGVLGQMVATITVERTTARARMQRQALRLTVAPTLNGALVGATLSF